MRIVLFLACLFFGASAIAAGPPEGKGSYNDLIVLYNDFLDYKAPAAWNPNFDDPEAPNHGLVDYGAEATAERLRRVETYRSSLAQLNVASWDRFKQSEFLAVRAQIDAEIFRLKVSRPWGRDPGFYVDQLLRFAFTELPIEGEARAVFERQLAAVPAVVEAARTNLDNVARDYAQLALRNLTTSDGVGHGHPNRATPPAGVIGWYSDLRARAATAQPDLVPAIEKARAAVVGYQQWLIANMERFTAQAGVGAARYDWYLKYAKLMPYTGDELILMSDMEWDRLTAFHALARHRNRGLDELEPAGDAKDYAGRIADTDKNIREFLEREKIITVPSYVGLLSTNVPYVARPGGLNFWEAVQFRDPHPDHLHAVIPGHRFDALVERNNTHPIRGRISDAARVEGWAVYLEESMLQAGVLAGKPRVDELIYLFGIFRAARVPADVKMQRNEWSVKQAVDFMRDRTPLLDEDVARVDAEIYLRRPPGYGVGYSIGAFQMRKLLAEVAAGRGEKFTLLDFHDELMASGRLPISLIRWEMLGDDSEIKGFWVSEPIPDEVRELN